MRIFSLAIIALVIFPASIYGQSWIDLMMDGKSSFFEVRSAFYQELANDSDGYIPGFKQFKRWEYFMEHRVNQDGYFQNHDAANQVYNDLTNTYTAKNTKGAAGNWTQLGPFGAPTGAGAGRTNCIAFHPTDPNQIILGSASGGIWRSIDGGNSWSTNTDGLENLGFSDIVYSQNNPNVVYAASGDRDGGDTYSIGLLKSFDAGLTWQSTGLTYGQEAKRKIYKILVHPSNDSIVILATSLGLRKSTDGGQTWAQIRAGSFVDAKFKPGDPNTIYAATSAIVIKTTDGGATWSTLSIPFVASNRRLIIAVTAANPDYVYVLSALSSSNGFGGIYRSIDGGATFSLRASSPNLLGWASDGNDSGGQGWYDLALEVSQTNPNLVFVGGINIWRSANGGSSWAINGHWTGSGAPYVHADIHEIKFSPHATTAVWACTDGGVSYSANNGSGWTERNTNLSIAQMYRLGGSSSVSSKVITGWQDNGTNYQNNTAWKRVLGGDGMECFIDYSNNNYMFGSLYYGNLRRSTNGGTDWTSISDDISEEGAWVSPFIQDPNTAATIYAGYENVYKSTNRGNSWTAISAFTTGQKLQALKVAESNSNVIYAATSYNLYKTTNAGQNWTNITSASFGTLGITYLAIHPTNPNRLWVTLSGYTNGYKVFYSPDGGSTWQNISSGLPNLPANTIVYEKNSPDGIYVGMDVGVYYRDTILGEWITFMKNLPNVIVKELEFFSPNQTIRAATYGRGLWESPVYSLANSIKTSSDQNLERIQISPNPSSGLITIKLENAYLLDANIQVFDVTGKLVLNNIVSNTNNYKIDLGNLIDGLYIIKILNNNIIHTEKVILRKY